MLRVGFDADAPLFHRQAGALSGHNPAAHCVSIVEALLLQKVGHLAAAVAAVAGEDHGFVGGHLAQPVGNFAHENVGDAGDVVALIVLPLLADVD